MKALDGKLRHPMMMEHERGGLYFKPGKDAYIHLTPKHCINVFKFYRKNSQ